MRAAARRRKGGRIDRSPRMWAVEVAAHGLARLDVKERPSVEPVDCRRPPALADGRTDRVDAWLEPLTIRPEFDRAVPGMYRQRAAGQRRGLLAIQRAAVAR